MTRTGPGAPLHAASLLDLLDRAGHQHPVERALTVLSAALPGQSREALAALSVGERDRALLRVQIELFPGAIECRGRCPRCGGAVSVRLDPAELLLPPAGVTELRVEAGGCEARVRLPTGADLRAAVRAPDQARAREALLRRVVLEARRGDAPLSELPPALIEAIDAALEAADPQADIELGLSCPDCAAQWSVQFDPEAALWTRAQAAAERLLDEVDQLARAYHWSEAEILNMSPRRRARYLQRVSP